MTAVTAFVAGAALLFPGTSSPPDSTSHDYISAAWREHATHEIALQNLSSSTWRSAQLDLGIAKIALGPFETLAYIRSKEVDPRSACGMLSAVFNVVRGDTCIGTLEVSDAVSRTDGSIRPVANLLGVFSPAPCTYTPIDSARALARDPRSIRELVLPLEMPVWRTILIDTEARGTLVMEFAPFRHSQAFDSCEVAVMPLADWAARTRRELRQWLRLDATPAPVSHEVADDAMRAAEAWLQGKDGRKMVARTMSQHRTYGRPTLGSPTLEFFLSELELAQFAESDEVDLVRFDANPRVIVPVVVEGKELLYPVLMRNRDELGRHITSRDEDYRIGMVYSVGPDGRSHVRPSGLGAFGHVALLTGRELGRWYHILGLEGTRISPTTGSVAGETTDIKVFSDRVRLDVRYRYQ